MAAAARERDSGPVRPIDMRTRHLLAAAAMLTLLAGCAAGGTGTASPDNPGSAPAPVTSAPTSTASSTGPGEGVIPQPTRKATNGTTITVVGTVDEGVEAKCLVLQPDDGSGRYLLMGGDPAVIQAGAHVRVTGVVHTDVMSYCMQGTPLEVTQAARA
jgi:hypothetical protein